jgi:hypothetical protein
VSPGAWANAAPAWIKVAAMTAEKRKTRIIDHY